MRAVVALSPVVGVMAALANPNFRQAIRGYFRNGAAMRGAALYLFFLLTAFYTSAWPEWWHQLYRLLPWVAVPLAFAVAVPLSRSQRLAVGNLFVLGTAVVGAATLGKYFMDPAAANDAISTGQNMPSFTRVFHIDFGIMLGLAFYFAWPLRRSTLGSAWMRWALLLAAVVVALTIHVLAYRTGLLVFYVAMMVNVFRLLFRRRFGWGLALLGVLMVGPWLLYQTMTPIRQRVGATLFDIYQFTEHRDINDYSLARRLAAWETALVLIKQHPVFGVAPADAYDAMMAQYAWHDYGLRPANWVMIHNQYLHQLVAGGVVGLGLWLLVLLWPLTQPKQRRNPYIWQFLLILGTGMLIDSILEMQIGLNLFVFGYGFLVVAGERHHHEKGATPRHSR